MDSYIPLGQSLYLYSYIPLCALAFRGPVYKSVATILHARARAQRGVLTSSRPSSSPWTRTYFRDSVFSRTLTYRYAPTPFAQDDLPGPELRQKFQQGAPNEAELKAVWDAKRPWNNVPKTTWPEIMQLYCRGCSEGESTEVYRKLS